MGVHDGHRGRMKKRFVRYGLDNFDDISVLELLLFYAIPSREDELTTYRVRDALLLVGITLADHIIVCGDDFVSFADSGLLGS